MGEFTIADELQQALDSLGRTIRDNPRPIEPEKERPRGKIIQFPLWPEPVRGMPTPALRSALFSAIQSKDRRFINYGLISAVNGIEIGVFSLSPQKPSFQQKTAVEAGEKVGTVQGRIWGLTALGTAYRLNMQWEEAVAVLREAIRAASSGGNRVDEGGFRAELAEALLGRGDLDQAEHEAQAAVRVAYARHSRCQEIRANLALARTQLRRADSEALVWVEQALFRAQKLTDETGARLYQPWVHECRACLAQLRGNAETARYELDAARGLYAEMSATAQVERLASESDGCVRQASLAEPGAES